MIQSLSLDSRIHAFCELGKVMGLAVESYTLPESNFKNQYPSKTVAAQRGSNPTIDLTLSRWAFPSGRHKTS